MQISTRYHQFGQSVGIGKKSSLFEDPKRPPLYWGGSIPTFFLLLSTTAATRLSTRLLWQIGHGWWEIENDLFHTLATYWSLDHCFRHEPTAILYFILTLFIAFVPLQSFYLGNLKSQRRAHLTLISVAVELAIGLAAMDGPAPWLKRGG
jgi:hypothetical protein